MPQPVFGTGLARSGGHLYNSLLSVNSEVMVVNCPFLEIYRSLRNAIIRQCAKPEIAKLFNYNDPFHDNYFSTQEIQLLDLIQASDIENIEFDEPDQAAFAERVGNRAALENEDLPPYFSDLKGDTFRELFDKGLAILTEARKSKNRKWVGYHEPWTVEFYPLLARTYPEAKFIIMFRDPRAMMNSVFGVARIDPQQVVHVLSNIRHWRRMAAFALKYSNDPLFDGRIFVSCHEDILRAPEDTARRFCEFLEVEYDPRMIDTSNYVYFATGETWAGNSSFETETTGIKASRASRWRTMLDEDAIQAIEFLCGAEMDVLGYRRVNDRPDMRKVSEYLVQERDRYSNWRTDFQDPQKDMGYELFRNALYSISDDIELDDDTVRRSFLFIESFHQLRTRENPGFLKTAHEE